MQHQCDMHHLGFLVTAERAATWDWGSGAIMAFEERDGVFGEPRKSQWTDKGVWAKRKKVGQSITAALCLEDPNRNSNSKPPTKGSRPDEDSSEAPAPWRQSYGKGAEMGGLSVRMWTSFQAALIASHRI